MNCVGRGSYRFLSLLTACSSLLMSCHNSDMDACSGLESETIPSYFLSNSLYIPNQEKWIFLSLEGEGVKNIDIPPHLPLGLSDVWSYKNHLYIYASFYDVDLSFNVYTFDTQAGCIYPTIHREGSITASRFDSSTKRIYYLIDLQNPISNYELNAVPHDGTSIESWDVGPLPGIPYAINIVGNEKLVVSFHGDKSHNGGVILYDLAGNYEPATFFLEPGAVQDSYASDDKVYFYNIHASILYRVTLSDMSINKILDLGSRPDDRTGSRMIVDGKGNMIINYYNGSSTLMYIVNGSEEIEVVPLDGTIGRYIQPLGNDKIVLRANHATPDLIDSVATDIFAVYDINSKSITESFAFNLPKWAFETTRFYATE